MGLSRLGCQSKLSFETLTISNVQVQQFLEQDQKPLRLKQVVAVRGFCIATVLRNLGGVEAAVDACDSKSSENSSVPYRTNVVSQRNNRTAAA